jgi:integrase
MTARQLGALVGDTHPREITELHLRSLSDHWKQKNKPHTRYNRLLLLRRLLRAIAGIAGTPALDTLVPKMRRPGPRTVIADPEELNRLLAAAPPWLRVIILLATHAALRSSDCVQAAPAHYDAERRTLSLIQKKTNQPITIPVTDTLAQYLEGVPPGDPRTPFYVQLRGKPLTNFGINRAWQRAKRKAGVNPELTTHDLRRTAAVTLYQLTQDLRAVEQLLGHRSLNSTIGYLEHRDPAKLKPYLEALWKPRTETVQ